MTGNLIALLFLSRDYAHRAHLKTESFSQHTALGSFYSSVVDLADRLAEACQGRHGLLEIPYLEGEIGINPVEVLEKHLKIIESVRYEAIERTDTALQAIIDDIVELYLSTLYKLRFLK